MQGKRLPVDERDHAIAARGEPSECRNPYLLFPSVDLSAGAGTLRYVPGGAAPHTDLRFTAGSGSWFSLFGHVDVRIQVQYNASWFSPPGIDGGLKHGFSTGTGLVVSLP